MAYNASCTPDLPPAALLNENMYFTGMFLSNIAYGAAVTLGLQCLVLLHSTVAGSPRARCLWSVIVLFILVSGTYSVAIGHIYQKIAFITYRDFPGGPSTWILIPIVNALKVIAYSFIRNRQLMPIRQVLDVPQLDTLCLAKRMPHRYTIRRMIEGGFVRVTATKQTR